MTPNSVYLSIFLDPDWAHEKYHGWKSIVSRPQFRVLLKQLGPLKQYLVLSQLGGDMLVDELRNLRLFDLLSIVTIKDFTKLNQDFTKTFQFDGRTVHQANEANRIFHQYTFAVDLNQTLEAIWSNMKSDNKRVCRKSMSDGMTIESVSSAPSDILSLFFKRYRKMAFERSLLVPSEEIIKKMFSDGHLKIFFAKFLEVIGSIILVYTASKTAIYLYGVPSERVNDGSGQLVQWKAMEHLKESGYHWYDLGGVPDINGKNGIYRFKMSIGGDLIDLGAEYYYCPSLLGWAKCVYKKLRVAL